MLICQDCYGKYFTEYSDISTGICEICDAEAEYKVDTAKARIKQDLEKVLMINAGNREIPLFAANRNSSSRNHEYERTSNIGTVEKMTAFSQEV